jgi:hypothetical protein
VGRARAEAHPAVFAAPGKGVREPVPVVALGVVLAIGDGIVPTDFVFRV